MDKKYLISFLTIVGIAMFVFRGPLGDLWTAIESRLIPCSQPITYSLGSFDARFGISKNYFLSALSDAEMIWEKPVNKELFQYEQDGDLKINLIYDIRQEATDKLEKLGIAVNKDRATFDSLKVKYDALNASYISDEQVLEARISAFEEEEKKYEEEVRYWNKRGGADQQKYDELNAEKDRLDREISEIEIMQESLNAKVDEINALAVVLNNIAASLNIKVGEFNQVGGTLGGEFEEGTYQSGPSGLEIDIYQFDNRAKLVRVMAHEFGHALGLDHVEDTKAIMYRLNNGINEKLTATDLAELKKRCNIQ
jgi:chromosome segregation ATPase